MTQTEVPEPALTAAPRRDPTATRERILNAALAEFSASGFAGARIQAIAHRAGVNARMLYHYFGEKDDLFRAILRRRFADRPIHPEAVDPAPLSTQMGDWFTRVVGNPDVPKHRGMTWRRRRGAIAIERIRAEQAGGRLADDLDADLLLLAMVALTTFPVASPPTVRLITGANPADAAFRRRYTRFLHRLSEHLSPFARTSA